MFVVFKSYLPFIRYLGKGNPSFLNIFLFNTNNAGNSPFGISF